MGSNEWETDTANLKGDALMFRLKINDMYEELKNKIEAKNVTIEQILFTDLQYLPNTLAVITGIRQMFEKLQIIISSADADFILKDVRKANQGKFECTYKEVIDYLTKRRINVAF
jgi:cysteine sulfinate desulfinase/cysteine desulfurase-like protein